MTEEEEDQIILELEEKHIKEEFKLFWDLSDPKKRKGYFALKIDAKPNEMLVFTTRDQGYGLLETLVQSLHIPNKMIRPMLNEIFNRDKNKDKIFPEDLPVNGERFPQITYFD